MNISYIQSPEHYTNGSLLVIMLIHLINQSHANSNIIRLYRRICRSLRWFDDRATRSLCRYTIMIQRQQRRNQNFSISHSKHFLCQETHRRRIPGIYPIWIKAACVAIGWMALKISSAQKALPNQIDDDLNFRISGLLLQLLSFIFHLVADRFNRRKCVNP